MNSSGFPKTLPGSRRAWGGSSQISRLVQNLPHPFALVDFNGYILHVNPAFEKVYGWKKKEIIHKYIPIVPPRLTGEFFRFLAKIRNNERVCGCETRRICKDRSEIVVNIDAFLLRDQKEEPVAIGEASRDITYLKKEQITARRSQKTWKALIDNASHLIIAVNKQQKITFANQRIKELLDYDVEEITNSSLSTLIADQHLEIVKKDLLEIITNDQMKSCTYQLKGKDGSIATYVIDWSSLKELSGKIEGAVGIARDVTREKEKETELIQSERLHALSDLVGGIAHHFNNLMTIILLQAQLIGRGIKEPKNEAIKKGLELINESCFRGKERVEQILEFVEGLSGKQFLMVNINEVIKQALSEVSVQLETKAIKVNTQEGEVPCVPGCFSELRKALTQILINAIEAMPQEGKLDIKTKRAGNLLLISIADSGIGMSEEVQKKMFEPFFTTKEPTRSGMGATFAYGILKKHGGKIRVFSTPKRGTTVVIELSIER